MEKIFEKRSECRRWLVENLQVDEQNYLLTGFVRACEVTPGDSDNNLAIRIGRWVIRNDDLDIFKVVRDAGLALAGAHFVFNNVGESAYAALVFAMVELLRKAHTKGCKISQEQAIVLTAIGAAKQPISTDDLLSVLSQTNQLNWDTVALTKELKYLSEAPTRSGPVKFIVEYSDNKWGIADT